MSVTTTLGWEVLGGDLECQTPFLRQYECELRRKIWQDEIGDDTVVEPWITIAAKYVVPTDGHWGISSKSTPAPVAGGAWKTIPALKHLDDVTRMIVPEHVVAVKGAYWVYPLL